MKKFSFLTLMLSMTAIVAACANDEATTAETASNLSGQTKTLVAFFSAQGHTQAVAERIAELTGADIYRIEAAEPYASNPYDDSERVQREAYNDLRPAVASPLTAEDIAKYDTLYIGTPTWWHQPAMVVCTFLESYDLSGKVVIPFATYGATTYLNETLQKLYKCTPGSQHIPASLPEDIAPDDIQHPQNDDAGIDQPGNARGVEAWLTRLGLLGGTSGIESTTTHQGRKENVYYTMNGMQAAAMPLFGTYIVNGKKYLAKGEQ